MEIKEKEETASLRLRLAREMSGLSQSQAAELLGMPRTLISDIENGTRALTSSEVARFAQFYDVSKAWLCASVAEKVDLNDEKLQLAARDLQTLEPNDLDQLLTLIAARQGAERNI